MRAPAPSARGAAGPGRLDRTGPAHMASPVRPAGRIEAPPDTGQGAIMMTPGRFIVDAATHTIRMDLLVRATPDWLFSAWVDPAQLRLWWDPTGKPLAVCEVDLREGVALKLVNADTSSHAFTGVYRRIERPHRLEFDALGGAWHGDDPAHRRRDGDGGGNPLHLCRASGAIRAGGRGGWHGPDRGQSCGAGGTGDGVMTCIWARSPDRGPAAS